MADRISKKLQIARKTDRTGNQNKRKRSFHTILDPIVYLKLFVSTFKQRSISLDRFRDERPEMSVLFKRNIFRTIEPQNMLFKWHKRDNIINIYGIPMGTRKNHVGIKPSHSIPSSFHHAMATFWWRSVGRVCYKSPAGCRRRDSPRSRAVLVKSWAIQNTQSHQLCVGLQPINVYKVYACPFPIGWLINRGFSYTI